MSTLNIDSPFESIRRVDEQRNEYWLARELMPLLDYRQWRRFEETIERAKISCKVNKNNPKDHFEFLPESAKTPRGGRPSDNYKLSRYACHLVAMNGDVRKKAIASAQAYFSAKACESEVLTPNSIEPLRALPQASSEERLAMATQSLKDLGVDLTNPRISQGLRDWALNLLGVVSLPSSKTERWLGVAERAEELGFGRIGADLSKRVKLGHWVSKSALIRRREKRLCNGEDREIWCYRVSDELDKAIAEFFEGIAV